MSATISLVKAGGSAGYKKKEKIKAVAAALAAATIVFANLIQPDAGDITNLSLLFHRCDCIIAILCYPED
jgi:hypothetical protein